MSLLHAALAAQLGAPVYLGPPAQQGGGGLFLGPPVIQPKPVFSPAPWRKPHFGGVLARQRAAGMSPHPLVFQPQQVVPYSFTF